MTVGKLGATGDVGITDLVQRRRKDTGIRLWARGCVLLSAGGAAVVAIRQVQVTMAVGKRALPG